jgi:hypothetical protein
MPKTLTTEEVRKRLWFEFDCEVAADLGISKVAVCKWRGTVPRDRVKQLVKMYPGTFDDYREDKA